MLEIKAHLVMPCCFLIYKSNQPRTRMTYTNLAMPIQLIAIDMCSKEKTLLKFCCGYAEIEDTSHCSNF